MHKRKLAAIVLISTLVVAVVAALLVTNRERIADRFETPNDDPQFFCSSPDPSPAAEVNGTSLVLRDCAAGKTDTLPRGSTIAIDLASGGRIDSGADFHDLTFSDPSILQTVSLPRAITSTRNGTPALDFVAVYKGIHSGYVIISALYRVCLGGSCSDSLRWEATVQIT
jgi:hypothetical protein